MVVFTSCLTTALYCIAETSAKASSPAVSANARQARGQANPPHPAPAAVPSLPLGALAKPGQGSAAPGAPAAAPAAAAPPRPTSPSPLLSPANVSSPDYSARSDLTFALTHRSTQRSLPGVSPLWYQHLEPLAMAEAEAALVVEVVCGRGAASVLAPAAFPPPARPARPWWQSDPQAQDILVASCMLLCKLVVDLFLRAAADRSHALVLAILQSALGDPDVAVRCRTFDLLYNLSIHTALLTADLDAVVPRSSAALDALARNIPCKVRSRTGGRGACALVLCTRCVIV